MKLVGSAVFYTAITVTHLFTCIGQSQVKFDFDPGALLSPPSQSGPKNNGDARAVRLDISDGFNNVAYTYDLTSGTNTVSADLAKYSRWAYGLAPGEGLAAFNIFLRGDYSNVYSWGQSLKLVDPNVPDGLFATAPEGWTWRVSTLTSNWWNPAWGYTLSWYTTDESKRIRPGVSMSGFSFTAPVVAHDYPTGQNSPVVEGNDYIVWFGSQNRPPDPAATGTVLKNVSFDNVWSDGVSGDTFADSDNTVWNGTVMLKAVPEPSSSLLVISGLTTLALLRRRK